MMLLTASKVGARTRGMTAGQEGSFQNPGVCLQAFPSFLPHPVPALLLAPSFAQFLTLVPHSLLLKRAETLVTQATPRGGGEYSHTLPIRVCASQRGRDLEAPDLERGIHFRGV